MLKAKFKTLKEQRAFFIKVKKKLNMGSRKLSKILGLKSRGSIENYTFMRTSPPVEIIKELEKISGIKAKYEKIEGKIYRKKREFMPMEPEIAKKILKDKFGRDLDYLLNLIKSNLTIKEIVTKIRKRGYSFDNSKISRCIGAYRTSLLSGIVNDINPSKEEIILKGHIRMDKKTLSINFNLSPLYKILNKKKIKVGLEISKDRKKIRIFPVEFGRKLIKTVGAIKILITEKSGLKIKSNIELILNPKKFGFSIIESIYDKDAKLLVKEALKRGFVLDNYRSTPANHKGDLSLYFKEKNIILEITRASSTQAGYFKVGQGLIQKNSWPKSIHFIICKKDFLSTDAKNALKKLKIKIINTNFNKGWEKRLIKEIENDLRK